MRSGFWLRLSGVALLFGLLSCGSSGKSSTTGMPSGSVSSVACNCTPSEPASSDFRHDQKHIPLPTTTGQDTTVATILGWAVGTDPAFDAPRSGVENQMFHIAQAYIQFVTLVPGDCDIHMEISDTPSKTAPRMIVETPIDSSYCPIREAEVDALSRLGVQVSTGGFETQQGIPADIVGLAFRDFVHQRGTQFVATPWELHPAIVTIK